MTDTPKPQADKFRDLARELECDEDEAAFEDKVRKVAKTPETELHRQVSYLRVSLAHARETAAGTYIAIAATLFGTAVFTWASLTITLDGEPESSAQWLCAGAGLLIAVCWLTAHNHHQQRQRDLAKAINESREAGYTVEIMRSGIYFSGRKTAS